MPFVTNFVYPNNKLANPAIPSKTVNLVPDEKKAKIKEIKAGANCKIT